MLTSRGSTRGARVSRSADTRPAWKETWSNSAPGSIVGRSVYASPVCGNRCQNRPVIEPAARETATTWSRKFPCSGAVVERAWTRAQFEMGRGEGGPFCGGLRFLDHRAAQGHRAGTFDRCGSGQLQQEPVGSCHRARMLDHLAETVGEAQALLGVRHQLHRHLGVLAIAVGEPLDPAAPGRDTGRMHRRTGKDGRSGLRFGQDIPRQPHRGVQPQIRDSRTIADARTPAGAVLRSAGEKESRSGT